MEKYNFFVKIRNLIYLKNDIQLYIVIKVFPLTNTCIIFPVSSIKTTKWYKVKNNDKEFYINIDDPKEITRNQISKFYRDINNKPIKLTLSNYQEITTLILTKPSLKKNKELKMTIKEIKPFQIWWSKEVLKYENQKEDRLVIVIGVEEARDSNEKVITAYSITTKQHDEYNLELESEIKPGIKSFVNLKEKRQIMDTIIDNYCRDLTELEIKLVKKEISEGRFRELIKEKQLKIEEEKRKNKKDKINKERAIRQFKEIKESFKIFEKFRRDIKKLEKPKTISKDREGYYLRIVKNIEDIYLIMNQIKEWDASADWMIIDFLYKYWINPSSDRGRWDYISECRKNLISNIETVNYHNSSYVKKFFISIPDVLIGFKKTKEYNARCR